MCSKWLLCNANEFNEMIGQVNNKTQYNVIIKPLASKRCQTT